MVPFDQVDCPVSARFPAPEMAPPVKLSLSIVETSVAEVSVNVFDVTASPPTPLALSPRTEMFVPEKVTAPVTVDGMQA
jgi:hypothetical protein